MNADTIRVGLIGAGANTRTKHIPGLKAQQDVEVAAVANRSHDSGERVAKEFDIPTVYDRWTDIIDDDAIDAVCIGTWPYMHCPATLAALDAGKHVLVEARMAMNSAEAHTMLEASLSSPGQVAQIVPAPHTLPIDRTIIDMVSDGYLGDLISVKAHIANTSSFPNPESPLHWRHTRDFSGNNIMTMGIWYEALMRWIGPASRVTSIGQVAVKSRRDGNGRRHALSIPDHVEVIGEMVAGGTLNLSVSTVIGLSKSLEVWLHGTEGTIRVTDTDFTNPGAPALEIQAGRRGDSSLQKVEIPESKRGAWRVEEEFVNAVRGLEPVTHTNFTDGVKYMEFTDAVTISIRTGESVELPLVPH